MNRGCYGDAKRCLGGVVVVGSFETFNEVTIHKIVNSELVVWKTGFCSSSCLLFSITRKNKQKMHSGRYSRRDGARPVGVICD